MKVVQINKDGTMDEIRMRMNTKNTCKQLIKCAKSQGNDSLKELYSWNFEETKIICYSWYDGEAGFENKHDLPPGGNSDFLDEDSSEKLLYGDIFICKFKDNKYIDLDITEYSEFYNYIFGGFDNCDTETEEEFNNTESEDEDYKPTDNEESDIDDNDYEIINDSDDELDIDENNY